MTGSGWKAEWRQNASSLKAAVKVRGLQSNSKTIDGEPWVATSPRLKILSVCLLVLAATIAAPSPAKACIDTVPPTLEDVSYADVVVIGRIENYRIIRDNAFRAQMLSDPNLPPEDRAIYQDPELTLLGDYARFEIIVEDVLKGRASATLSVTWDNSTFGLPIKMARGRYLIALHQPGSTSPPLGGPSATIMPSPEPDGLMVLQAPCSSAFIYDVESDQARSIQKMLSGNPR